jgi:hypothetical protein
MFVRKFTEDPGLATIEEIEGVVVIDREPPGAIQGANTGIALCVGEFEDGPYGVPTEIGSATDLANTFGGFGFTYDGVGSQNPCARARLADNAVKKEYWNGNGFISLVNKRFSGLIICRVDTSIGEVMFSRLASILGRQAFSYALESGQTAKFAVNEVDGLASPGRITSSAGTYPLALTSSSMSVAVDGATAVPVTFSSAHSTRAHVIDRINEVLGYAAASADATDATKIVLRSRNTGTTSSIEITAVTAMTGIGFAVAPSVPGTDNQDTATFTAAAAVRSSTSGAYPTTFVGGESATIVVDEGTPNQVGPFTVVFQASDSARTSVIARINEVFGFALATAGTGTVIDLTGRVKGTAGNVKVTAVSSGLVTTATGLSVGATFGTGNVANIGQTTFAEVKRVIEAAIVGLTIEQAPSGELRATASTSVWAGNGTASALGFVLGDYAVALESEATSIPAGTRVSDGVTVWVTASTVAVPANSVGPFKARVRPAVDNGTAAGCGVGACTRLVSPITGGSFSVTNLTAIAAALSETAIDAAYVKAFDATLNSNSVARRANMVFSARQSSAIRTAGRSNAIRSAREGLAGRMFYMRPPLGTTRAIAKSTVAQPGVGAYRDRRIVYAFPGVSTYVPQIAQLGLAGGEGFTADGFIDVGFDSWEVSIASQLAPEQNPGQETGFASLAVAIERNNPDVQDLQIADYIQFKAAGIAAPKISEGVCVIASGVTSVNPATHPGLKNIARQRMADFIQDSVSQRLKAYSKRANTRDNRASVMAEIEGFLSLLLSKNNPKSQRIDSYFTDGKTPNTPDSLARGLYWIVSKVRTLSSMDVIVFDSEIGENVITFQQREAA